MNVLLLFCVIATVCAAKDYTGYQVWRTYPTKSQLNLLRQLQDRYGLDVWSHSIKDGDFEDFVVPPHHIDKIQYYLNYKGLEFTVMIPELQNSLQKMLVVEPRENEDNTFQYDIYHTFDDLQTWIDTFIQNNTSSLKLTKETVGSSFEGREFSALKISSGAADAKAFVIVCGIHGREWVSHATCPLYAKYLVENYQANADDESNMLAKIDFYIIPVANPDSYVYTWEEDRMWRKTRSIINGCNSNCIGVDPNRNFDSAFGGEGSSNICCSDSYHGPSPFSEACVNAQREYIDNIPNVVAYIDFHAYSQYWMFPYGYTEDTPGYYDDLNIIASQCVSAIYAKHGRVYEAGQISQIIYVASGGSVDYYYDTQGIACSFGVEIRDNGLYGFTLPADEIVPTAEEAYEAIKVVGNNIISNKCIRLN